jgi:hypothetical protein
VETVSWNQDRSVVHIATAGSRRKTVTTDVILAGFLGCVLLSYSLSELSGPLGVIAAVLVVSAGCNSD